MSHPVYCAKRRNFLAPQFHDVFLKSSSEGPPRREELPVLKPPNHQTFCFPQICSTNISQFEQLKKKKKHFIGPMQFFAHGFNAQLPVMPLGFQIRVGTTVGIIFLLWLE